MEKDWTNDPESSSHLGVRCGEVTDSRGNPPADPSLPTHSTWSDLYAHP